MPDLPPELAELELALAKRAVAPPPALRGRVLAAVAGELPAQRRGLFWRRSAALAAGVALALAVGLNLVRSAVLATDYRLARAPEPDALRHTTAQIAAALPDLPPDQQLRMALLTQAGDRHLVLAPPRMR